MGETKMHIAGNYVPFVGPSSCTKNSRELREVDFTECG